MISFNTLFICNKINPYGFKVKVLLASISDDACPRNRETSGFGVSRRGCGGHHRVQYQSVK